MSYFILVDGTDVTDFCPEESIELGGQATIESTTGELIVDDDSGVAVTAFKARKVIVWVEDATTPNTTLARGRVDPIDYSRGTLFTDDAHQKKITIADQNSHLRGIIVDGWTRPEESDYARVMALVAAYLSGSSSTSPFARDSTDLDTTYVVNANTVTMPAETYKDTDPAGVLDDCIRAANKVAFVTVDDELFYAVDGYTGYAANLAIRDDTADTIDGVGTIWAPDWTGRPGTESGQELISGAKLKYGNAASVIEHRGSVASAYDKWEEVIYDDGAKGATDAASRLSKLLDARGQLDKTYACSIEMDETQVDKVKVGQTLEFRAAAANVRSPITVRVARLMWEIISPGPPRLYRANLELSKPKKLAPFGNRGGIGIIAREEVPPSSSAPTESVTGSCVTQGTHATLRKGDLDGDGIVTTDNLGSGLIGSNVSQNVPYTVCGCPIGGGGWKGWKDEEEWAPYTMPADDPDYIGAEVTIDATSLVWIGPWRSGFDIRVAAEYPSSTNYGAGTIVGHIVDGEVVTVYIPRSLIVWGATLSVIVTPGWHCARGAFYCNGVADFTAPYDDARGDSGGVSSGFVWSDVCPIQFVAGSTGSSGWVAGFGDVDGVNRVFTLIDWSTTGPVEVSINGLIQPNADVTLDTGAGTATLADAPPEGSIVLFLYQVAA